MLAKEMPQACDTFETKPGPFAHIRQITNLRIFGKPKIPEQAETMA